MFSARFRSCGGTRFAPTLYVPLRAAQEAVKTASLPVFDDLIASDELPTLRIGNATWQFCSNRGLTSECRDWLTRALAESLSAETPEYIEGLVSAGHLAERQRDLDVAEGLFEAGARLAAGNWPLIESRALTGLGFVNGDRGDYATAIGFHQRLVVQRAFLRLDILPRRVIEVRPLP